MYTYYYTYCKTTTIATKQQQSNNNNNNNNNWITAVMEPNKNLFTKNDFKSSFRKSLCHFGRFIMILYDFKSLRKILSHFRGFLVIL